MVSSKSISGAAYSAEVADLDGKIEALRRQYLSQAQVCEILQISKATLFRWRQELGFPKPKKFGPNVARYDVAAVDVWLAKRAELAAQ